MLTVTPHVVPRISTTIRERRLRFSGHCWRSNNKLLAVWFCGNRSKAKGESEDRLAQLSICWRRTPGSPETACRQRWMTGLAGERELPAGETERVWVFPSVKKPSGAETKPDPEHQRRSICRRRHQREDEVGLSEEGGTLAEGRREVPGVHALPSAWLVTAD